jgi:hypothetical protein
MPWRTTKGLERIGKLDERFGQTGKPTRARFAPTSSLPATRGRHLGKDPNVERYDPDLWTDEFAFLNQSGQIDIQTELFLRLPKQCGIVSEMAGMDARAPTTASGDMGQVRSFL